VGRGGGATSGSVTGLRATVPVRGGGARFLLAKDMAACCRQRGDCVGEHNHVEEDGGGGEARGRGIVAGADFPCTAAQIGHSRRRDEQRDGGSEEIEVGDWASCSCGRRRGQGYKVCVREPRLE
jgi:hypothetical protein